MLMRAVLRAWEDYATTAWIRRRQVEMATQHRRVQLMRSHFGQWRAWWWRASGHEMAAAHYSFVLGAKAFYAWYHARDVAVERLCKKPFASYAAASVVRLPTLLRTRVFVAVCLTNGCFMWWPCSLETSPTAMAASATSLLCLLVSWRLAVVLSTASRLRFLNPPVSLST